MRGTMAGMKRSSLRLSLREMFLLVLVVGMGLGWYREYQIAAPIRAAYRNLEPHISQHQLSTSRTDGRYRGMYFEVHAMTQEYLDSPEAQAGDRVP